MTGGGAPCGACQFLRRKCLKDCVFAPYFCSNKSAAHFAAVHKVFGASNVSKLLLRIPTPHQRCEAVMSIFYEAQARLEDPVYGCVSHIFALQRQVANLQAQLNLLQSQLAERLAVNPRAASNGNQYNPIILGGADIPNYEYSADGANSSNSVISSSISTSTSACELHFAANLSSSCPQIEIGNSTLNYNGVLSKGESAAVCPKLIGDYDELAMSGPFHESTMAQPIIDEDNYSELLGLQGTTCEGEELQALAHAFLLRNSS